MGYIGIMEKKMEPIILRCRVIGFYRDNGTENRSCFVILRLHWVESVGFRVFGVEAIFTQNPK